MSRYLATKILVQIIFENKSLSQLRTEINKADPKDKALVQELCYGVTRWFYQLSYIVDQFLDKPLKHKDGDVFVLMMLGVYQVLFTRIPDHAAISETVNVARKLKKEWATKLINAVLRRFLKNQTAILEKLPSDEEAYYSHPEWFIEKLKASWESWKIILETNNKHPLQCLRVNQQRISRDDYLALLAKEDIAVEVIPWTKTGIQLLHPIDLHKLPKFHEGYISVQDGAAQLAAEILDPKENETILDACAAPGGKTCHILEIQPQLKELVALDNDPLRLGKIKENLSRLQLDATLLCEDVLTWKTERRFDRILLDVPCSASGVIRRHPDIKLLREASDIPELAKVQHAALLAIWRALKPGGTLLYVTCSVFPEENEQVLKRFLEHTNDSREVEIKEQWGMKLSVGRQILPGMYPGMDGFYFAKLERLP